ncbi:hypothetical protein [Pengzhenrongella sicca]|uniref:Ig-like domain repeat protein n=1 Tax=Pengzhenrongella sicca TaxID=2819238 RepID=A0A8A4ZE11_9MICO|nr:hypothetical protein [Pengzhenrongella sicca]QTE30220.1 hypothetical protein J4E96_04215 [Pengzhenrongella sicca]
MAIAALGGLAVAGLASPGMAADPQPRIAALHPFAVSSPANTAIGSGAIFEAATDVRTAALLRGTPTINSTGWSIAVAIATEADPMVTLTNTSTGVVRSIRMPSGAQVTTGTDKAMTIVQPDGYTAYECYKMTKVSATSWTSTHIVQTDLRSDGLAGGTRAAGISQLVGLIRTAEVAADAIPHALAVSIPDSMLGVGPVWPARLQDNNAATAYKGPIAMGTMLGIPASVDLASLGLSAEGLAVARAFQDYGAYVVDRSETVALYAEPLSDQGAVARMKADYQQKLFPLLRVLANSSAGTVGGGGNPRQPAASGLTAVAAAPAAGTTANVAPIGFVDSMVVTGAGVTVQGWTGDADTAGPIAVHVYVDNSPTGTVANLDRPDLGGLFANTLHGFSVTVPAAAGTHRVCAYAINVAPGANPSLGCRSVTVSNVAPIGFVDSMVVTGAGVTVQGWTGDADTAGPIAVHVYVDNSPTGTVANLDRPDLGSLFANTSHGFSVTVPAAAGTHRVCAYAINVAPGANPSLGCRSVTVSNVAPIGFVDSMVVTGAGVTVQGWTGDADTAGPIAVHVYVDNSPTGTVANLDRPDLGSLFANTSHGFSVTVPAAAGTHRVCAYAINVAPGANPSLGCRSLTV